MNNNKYYWIRILIGVISSYICVILGGLFIVIGIRPWIKIGYISWVSVVSIAIGFIIVTIGIIIVSYIKSKK